MTSEVLLSVEGLEVGYASAKERSATSVLRGVTFTVSRGQRVAVVGESGSGKSTLARSVLGMLPRNGSVGAGSVRFLGDELIGASEGALRTLRGNRIGYIAQDPHSSLDPLMRVGDQAAEGITAHRRLPRRERRLTVEQAFSAAGLPEPAANYRAYPHQLSGGMRQRSLIGASLVNAPDLVIADEPTSALDATVQKRILDHLDSLVADGSLGVLIITHDFGVVARHADVVVVLQHGVVVESGAVAEVLANPRHEYTRALLDAVPRAGAPVVEETEPAAAVAGPFVVVDSVSKTYPNASDPALHSTTLSIPRGQTLAIVGESGSGKSTLGGIVLGSLTADSGSVRIDGQDVAGISRRRSRGLRRSVQAVFQDPYSSLDPLYTVERTLLEPLAAARIGTSTSRSEAVRRVLQDVGLPESVLRATSAQLSGGQCQRVAIARALIVEPTVLICDEPVSALDVVVQRQVLDLLSRVQRERNLTVLFISHDLAVVREIADTVAVMQSGRVVELAEAAQLFSAPRHPYSRELLEAAFPVDAPQASAPHSQKGEDTIDVP